MKYFDLHCDTLCELDRQNQSLLKNNLHVDINRAEYLEKYIQCMAVWIDDELKGKDAKDYFVRLSNMLEKYNPCKNINDYKNKNIVLIPTLENASALSGDIKNIELLKKYGIKMVTLTWNSDNEIGSGVAGSDKGLTNFGKTVIDELTKNNITIDISHASEKLFWDVCNYTDVPVVASHSNAYSVCSHKRNLKDQQIREIVRRKGLIGLNFYKNFLNDNQDEACINDLIKHFEYILGLGAENVLAFGSDFDGSDMPKDIHGVQSISEIYNAFVKNGYKKELIDNVFYMNAYNFFLNKYTV